MKKNTKTPKVEIIGYTANPLDVIYLAYSQCYAKKPVDLNTLSYDNKVDYIKRMLETGHDSPLEHVTLTFRISDVSKACTHQLVRSRIASYSQQSGRYVGADNMNYITPDSIKRIPEAKELYEHTMQICYNAYEQLASILKDNKVREFKGDARYIMPQAVVQPIVVTMNIRALFNFFNERTCSRAQEEIRDIARQMLEASHELVPFLIPNVHKWCDTKGYCKESEKNTCHAYHTLKHYVR